MREFIAKFEDEIMGVLSGFDRLVLRASLRAICCAQGMEESGRAQRHAWRAFLLARGSSPFATFGVTCARRDRDPRKGARTFPSC